MAINKLDAINMCLRGISRDPVATVDDPDLDSALALSTIEQLSSDLQTVGYWFNKEYNWNLTLNTAGEVIVPNNALSVLPEGDNRGQWLAIRGNRLYDVTNHTYNLTNRLNGKGEINLSFIMELEFDETPPVFRMAIAYMARRMFAQDLEVDQNRWQFQIRDEERTLQMLEKEEARHRRRNYLRDNAQVASNLAQIGGPNSHAYTNRVFPRRDYVGG